MKMIDMAMKKDEKGKSAECCCGAPCDCDSDKPRYPWGLQLNLENDQLEALGIKTLPKVGTSLTVHCLVKVTRCSEDEREGGEPARSVALQITGMAIEAPGMTDNEKAGILYSNGEVK